MFHGRSNNGFGGQDSSRAMAAVLAAAVSRARGRIFMQRSGSALKMQPLAVKVINLSSGQGAPAQSLKVRVPAGIEDGKSIRLRGKGGPGMNGGEAGDLLLKIHVDEKPGYERKGMDVLQQFLFRLQLLFFGGEAIV